MPPTRRPNFHTMWSAFQDVAPPPPTSARTEEAQKAYLIDELHKIGDTIGGRVKTNFDMGVKDVQDYPGPGIFPPHPQGFTNGCATRLSYVLHKAGIAISPSGNWRTVSGADKQNYIFTVREMKLFLASAFGKPNLQVSPGPTPQDFAGRKGIITFDVHFSDATGHATLWDGTRAIDEDYFYPGRGLVCSAVRLWECP